MSNAESLNVKEMAEALGVSEGLIRKDAKTYQIPSHKIAQGNKAGQRVFDSELLAVFRQIRELKDQGLKPQEIRLNIADAIKEAEHKAEENPPLFAIDQDVIIAAVAEKLRGEVAQRDRLIVQDFSTELTSKLMFEHRKDTAEMLKQITDTQAKVLELSTKLSEAQTKANLLPDLTNQTEEAQKRADTAAKELETYKQKCERLEKENKAKSLDLSISKERIEELEAQNREKDTKINSLSSQLQATGAELEETRAQLQEAKRPWWKSKK